MNGDDHDRMVRVEEHLAAVERALDSRRGEWERERAVLQQEIDDLKRGQGDVVRRVDGLATEVASTTGQSTGTMRIFVAGALVISLASFIIGIVR